MQLPQRAGQLGKAQISRQHSAHTDNLLGCQKHGNADDQYAENRLVHEFQAVVEGHSLVMAHFLFPKLLRTRFNPLPFRLSAVQGPDGFDSPQKLHDGSVHVGLGVQQFQANTFLRADLTKYQNGADGNHQNHQAGHQKRQLQKDGHNGGKAGGYRRGEIHEHQLHQLDGTFQAPVQPSVDVSGHVAAKVGQRSQQQGSGSPLPCILLSLGSGVFHDEPAQNFDDLVDYIDQKNHQQNRDDGRKGNILLVQHKVCQISHSQRGNLIEASGQNQNQKNEEKACFLLFGENFEQFLPDGGCFHGAGSFLRAKFSLSYHGKGSV